MMNEKGTGRNFSERQVRIATRLLYLGLHPKLGNIDEYEELSKHIKRNPQVESLLRLMTEEFNMEVLDISENMLSLTPKQSSIFATRAEDYEFVTSTSDKEIFGLILISTAAYLFPNQWMLENEQYEGEKFEWRDIDDYIRQKIEDALENKSQYEQSEAKEDEGLQSVLFQYRKIKPDKGSLRDRSTTRYFIGKVLDYLHGQGFLAEVEDNVYHPTRKFKVHTKQLLQDEYFQELLEIGND